MDKIAYHVRRLMASLKTWAAMSVVDTLSKLSNREAVAAGVGWMLKSNTI